MVVKTLLFEAIIREPKYRIAPMVHFSLTDDSNDSQRQSAAQTTLTVSELNSQARRLLEIQLGHVSVEGELSGLVRAASGHWYFTLKDRNAQIRCAMFRNNNRNVTFVPDEGVQLTVRGRVSLYEGRGDYQLIVNQMTESGFGALQRAFEALKAKLDGKGLFDPARKRELPTLPAHIGLITSPIGAAVHDVLSVLKRRFPLIPVTLIPCQVQGDEAAAELTAAIRRAEQTDRFDVLLLTRGGGSLEDLWPFNDEALAHAIAACKIPVISAVGHEVDWTIADHVADARAPTPSAAAEMLSPDQQVVREKVLQYRQRLTSSVRQHIEASAQSVDHLSGRLHRCRPETQHQQLRQQLTHIHQRLQQTMTLSLTQQNTRLQHLHSRLAGHSPLPVVETHRSTVMQMQQRLQLQQQQQMESSQNRLKTLVSMLNAVSPLATLARGYAIVHKDAQRTSEQRCVRSVSELRVGDRVTAKLHEGLAHCEVTDLTH